MKFKLYDKMWNKRKVNKYNNMGNFNSNIRIIYANGSIYEGPWNYLIGNHGKGKVKYYKYYKEGEYEGDVLDNKRHGIGKMTYKNYYGDSYHEDNDKFRKEGIYEGHWENDLEHGSGKMTFKKKNWQKDYAFDPDDPFDDQNDILVLEGKWENGKLSGCVAEYIDRHYFCTKDCYISYKWKEHSKIRLF